VTLSANPELCFSSVPTSQRFGLPEMYKKDRTIAHFYQNLAVNEMAKALDCNSTDN